MNTEDHLNQIHFEYFRDKLLDTTRTVYDIPEFDPIKELCKQWLSQRDEAKYKKTNQELLESYMTIRWISAGLVEKFTCPFISKFDFIENNDKAKLWISCVKDFINNEYLKQR